MKISCEAGDIVNLHAPMEKRLYMRRLVVRLSTDIQHSGVQSFIYRRINFPMLFVGWLVGSTQTFHFGFPHSHLTLYKLLIPAQQRFFFFLVSCMGLILLFLFEPALFDGSRLAGSSLAFDLRFLALVGLQLVGKRGLFRRRRGLGSTELLDVSLGITGLGRGGLVGADFAKVEVLDWVGYFV
jgi:hypothetical protein